MVAGSLVAAGNCVFYQCWAVLSFTPKNEPVDRGNGGGFLRIILIGVWLVTTTITTTTVVKRIEEPVKEPTLSSRCFLPVPSWNLLASSLRSFLFTTQNLKVTWFEKNSRSWKNPIQIHNRMVVGSVVVVLVCWKKFHISILFILLILFSLGFGVRVIFSCKLFRLP